MRSFLANGHPFHLYVYEDVAGIPPGTTVRDGREILPEDEICYYEDGFGKGSPSLFSNLFRYKFLLERGGFWSDMDIVCLAPLVFADEYVFGRHQRPDGSTIINVGLIKTPPNAPVMRRCWESVTGIDRQAARWAQTGPQLMNDAVIQEGLERYVQPVERFYPIHFPRFSDILTDTTLPADSLTVHLWHAAWIHHGLDPDGVHAKDSLYERLKARYL